MFRTILQIVGVLGILGALVFVLRPIEETPSRTSAFASTTKDSATFATTTIVSKEQIPVDEPIEPAQAQEQPVLPTSTPDPDTPKETPEVAAPQAQNNQRIVARLNTPYDFPAKNLETVNLDVREALVNIFCESTSGSFNSISGSGTILDPRGVIITNAHVAQYLLLSTRPETRLSCTIRMGSPARQKYQASLLFMPEAWVREHAADLKYGRKLGTGEHDYALLLITETTDGSPLPESFPYVPYDAREAIGFTNDSVLLAAYPAEFSAGIQALMNLYASSAITRIQELLTFHEGTIDVLSLGGVILAQSGSSGGAVVNAWGRLIGIVSTTSEGDTTAERDLRAISMSYVDRALYKDAGVGLATILSGNLTERNRAFMDTKAPALAQIILDHFK